MTFAQLVEGPLWLIAAAVFVVVGGWRIVGILRLGGERDISVPRGSAVLGALRGNLLHFVPHGGFFRRAWYHFAAGYLFHLGLFALLLFAAPHVAFIEKRLLGVAWAPMPDWAFVVAAEAAFAGLILLYVRRISDPVMRQISDADDHVGSWLVFLAMLTGCLALEAGHESLRLLHMLAVEGLLVYVPFSRLMHAVTFVLSRGYTGAAYGRRGVTP